jgi:hypothetical protein
MYATARLFNRRNLIAVFLLLFVMSVAYGFAAANTVPVSGAGDGAGQISGYNVSDIAYTLGANPKLIEAVDFTLTADVGAPEARVVTIQLVQGSGDYFTCSVAGSAVNCPVGGKVTVLAANELTVIAVD